MDEPTVAELSRTRVTVGTVAQPDAARRSKMQPTR
jgi:hypothetical protein